MATPEENSRPHLSFDDVYLVLNEEFGISRDLVDEVNPLVSFDDQNFHVKLNEDKEELVLKITNWKDSQNRDLLEQSTMLMDTLSDTVRCPKPKLTLSKGFLGNYAYNEGTQQRRCAVRLFDFIPGSMIKGGTLTPQQAFEWGEMLGRMHKSFSTMNLPVVKERGTSMLWGWMGVPRTLSYAKIIKNEDHRTLITEIIERYANEFLPTLMTMKRDILHGDPNEHNVLLDDSGSIHAILDFGDCQGGPFIWDMGVTFAYLGLVVPNVERDVIEYLGEALAGYCKYMPHVVQENVEVDMLRVLACSRLSQSLTLGLQAFECRGDPYVITTQKVGWRYLEKLYNESSEELLRVWQAKVQPYGVLLR